MNRLVPLLAAAQCLLWAHSTAAPALSQRWTEYRTIMWIGDSAYKDPAKVPLFFQRLREMGINTAMVFRDGDPAPVLENGFPYYVENMVNRGLCLKFSSKVTDWDRWVTRWSKERDPQSLGRDYCLDDPGWRDWAKGEMRSLARKNAGHEPLAYDIRDELSVTVSANPFDYDFSPLALEGFRAWLQTQYQDLAALNAEWETAFASWAEVKPFTTDQIKARMASNQANPPAAVDWQALRQLRFNPAEARQTPTRWNFAPWADFRTYMDLSLARALDDLRQAAHAADPRTPVGIEGTQMPAAFGGYDLWRLSQVLDWVEPYDIGNAREIFGSFMPVKPIVTTVGESDPAAAARRLWHLLLLGDRGCIVWWSEDCLDWKTYELTPHARALAPVLREMASPLAQLFMRATRESDPIAIYYSQPSIQTDWLVESIADGSTWLRRFSSFEAEHNHLAKVRNGWLKAVQDAGYAPVFVSSAQVEAGVLTNQHFKGLVLPQALAISDREVEQITAFAHNSEPREILCDGIPALFDAHAKWRKQGPPALFAETRSQSASALLRKEEPKSGDIAQYAVARLRPQPELDWARWVADALKFLPREAWVDLDCRARVHRFRIGTTRLLAVERNINYQMSEDLKQAGGNQNLERPGAVDLHLAKPAHVYDLRAQSYLGYTARVSFQLDPWRPALFALLEEKLPAGEVIERLSRSAL